MGETQSSEEEEKHEHHTNDSLWLQSLNDLKPNGDMPPKIVDKRERIFTGKAPDFNHIEPKRVKERSRKHGPTPK